MMADVVSAATGTEKLHGGQPGKVFRLTAGMWVLVMLPLASTSDAQSTYPTSPPPPAPLETPNFPPFQEARLANGLRMVVIERHHQPVLSISLSLPAGSAYDPPGREGLAEMVAGLLTRGAGERDAEQVAEAIEGVGGALRASAGVDFLTVSANVLSPDAPLAFSLLADAVRRPSFLASEVDLTRTQTLSGLQLLLTQPASLASMFFDRHLYGDHPYGRSATPASVGAITRDELVAYQQSRLRPDGALLVIAGDIRLATARDLADRVFDGWAGSAPVAAAFPAPPPRTSTRIILVHRPGSVQSNIVVGNVAFGPADPLRYGAAVANHILGGGADARLFTVLREQKGWTYSAQSTISRPVGPGAFEAATEVRTAVTDSALTELLAQLRTLRSQPVSADELNAALGALVGRFPLTIQTAQQIAGAVAQARLLGLGSDYLELYRKRLAAVTASDVERATRAVIHPDSALVVVVGDGAAIYEGLSRIAPVQIVDVSGRELTPDDLVTGAASITLDPAALAAGVDSFAVMVQGREFGYMLSGVAAVGDGYEFTETSVIGPLLSQSTTIRVDRTLAMHSVKQRGKVQGRETGIDVSYAGGVAKGSAATPGPTGAIDSVDVDAPVPDGVVDDNALNFLIPTMPWAADASFKLPVFASGKGQLLSYTLTVTGSESVTVPAGTFDAYRVEVTGAQQPLTMFVERDGRHRLLRLQMTGTPVELVRIR